MPVPVLASVTVKPIWSPAETSAASAVLVTETAAGRHVIWPESDVAGLFVAWTVAVLSYAAHCVAEVGLRSSTVRVAPGARSPKLQVIVPVAIAQSAEFSVHVPPAGSGSESVTPRAGAVPVLPTVIEKTASSPASIVCPSGVLAIVRFGVRGALVNVQ